jgi:hypothetical protein
MRSHAQFSSLYAFGGSSPLSTILDSRADGNLCIAISSFTSHQTQLIRVQIASSVRSGPADIWEIILRFGSFVSRDSLECLAVFRCWTNSQDFKSGDFHELSSLISGYLGFYGDYIYCIPNTYNVRLWK